MFKTSFAISILKLRSFQQPLSQGKRQNIVNKNLDFTFISGLTMVGFIDHIIGNSIIYIFILLMKVFI